MTQTPSLHLTQPTVGGDTGLWGGYLNTDMTLIDRGVNGSISIPVPDANVTLTHDGTTNDQSIYQIYSFTGALTADRTITLPANQKVGIAINATTGSRNLLLKCGAGTQLTVKPDGQSVRFWADGTNVSSPTLTSGLYSNGATGYAVLSGGILLQWGTATITSGGEAVISFPLTFSALYSVNATLAGATSTTTGVAPIGVSSATSTSQLRLWCGAGQTVSCFWQAIGT